MSKNQTAARWARVMRALPQKAQAGIKAAILAEGGKVVAYAQIKAPKGPAGNLRKSIRMEDVGRFYVQIKAGGPLTTVATRKGWLGGTYDYARAQEWGTKDMPANPYFYSTARAANKRLKPVLKEKVRNSLKKAYDARG